MNLDLLDDVDGQLVQIEVLSMIEAGARERGDLELANDAAFRRSQLEADRADGVDQMIRLSGEAFGGYLVQPFYPIRAMLILIIIGTVVRWIARLTPQLSRHSLVWDLSPALATADATAPVPVASRGVDEPELPRGAAAHDQLLWLSKALAIGARALSDTIRAAVRLRPRDIPEQRRDDLAAYATAFLAGGEWLAYKVLFALFIIGLANANPTFKQLVEAVR